MAQKNLNGKKAYVTLSVLFVAFAIWTGFRLDYAELGSVDQGKLFLAGATSILRGERIQVTQRAPLYSVLLAVVGRVLHVKPYPGKPIAEEMGQINRYEVADDFLTNRFTRTVLWLHILLWVLTAFVTVRTLRAAGLPYLWSSIPLFVFAIPSYWYMCDLVFDVVFTQFLLACGVLAFIVALKRTLHWIPLGASGTVFALSALSRPTFQLLNLVIAAVFLVPMWRNYGGRNAWKLILAFTIPWLVFVGGWSYRNYREFGFYGVSSATGIALSTRTAPFVQRAEDAFPDILPPLIELRNQRMLNSKYLTPKLWGEDAVKWLMRERGYSYIRANQLLIRMNLVAIARAPLNYLNEVLNGVASFHIPDIPAMRNAFRLPLTIVELILIFVFLLLMMLWISFRILSRFSPIVNPQPWSRMDHFILCAIVLYAYTVLISCSIDLGKPEHRATVQFLFPLTSLLIAYRLALFRTKRSIVTSQHVQV